MQRDYLQAPPPAFHFVAVGKGFEGDALGVAIALRKCAVAVPPDVARLLARRLEMCADLVEAEQREQDAEAG